MYNHSVGNFNLISTESGEFNVILLVSTASCFVSARLTFPFLLTAGKISSVSMRNVSVKKRRLTA